MMNFDDWDMGDWKLAYEERAAILEHEAAMPRREAEARAWEMMREDYMAWKASQKAQETRSQVGIV